MRKIVKSFKWYTVIILLCILLFSILCWFSFVKNNFKRNTVSQEITATQLADSAVKETQPNAQETTEAVNTESESKTPEAVKTTAKTSKISNGMSYLRKIDAIVDKVDSRWYESMFEKNRICQVDSVLTYYCTNQISSNQVLKGEGGWLFYKSETDADSIGDYEGSNQYSDEEMQNFCDLALNAQETALEKGIQFALLIPPNKENVYSEFMPDSYHHAEKSRTDLLIDYMKDWGVNALSAKERLVKAHQEQQLYYYYDTHWNQLGAYIGVRELLSTWEIKIPELTSNTITEADLKNGYHMGAMDDLAQMTGLLKVFDDDKEYTIEENALIDWSNYKKEQAMYGVSYYSNPDAENSACILLLGDSFRTAMVPTLSRFFKEVYVFDRSDFYAEMLDEINPQYMVVEYVERYSFKMTDLATLIR